MTREELNEKLRLHGMWFRGEPGWIRAILRGAKNVDTVIVDAHTAFYALQCPESGAYTAYKKRVA